MQYGRAHAHRYAVAQVGHSLVLAALVLASVAVVAASALDLVRFNEANLLLASGGAIALGIVLASFGLYVRFQESQQIHDFEIRLQETETRLGDAIAFAEQVRRRFGHEEGLAELRKAYGSDAYALGPLSKDVPEERLR